jgi:predicted DNA-binding protein
MRRKSKTVTIRLPDEEARLLAEQAKKTGRTRTDLLRSHIRSFAEPKPKKGPRQ